MPIHSHSDVRDTSPDAFLALKTAVTNASHLMTGRQILELADSLHDLIRERRAHRYAALAA